MKTDLSYKKHILIDATTVTNIIDGLSQYIINLIKNFPEDAFLIFDFSILVNKNIERKELKELINSGKFKIIECDISPIGPRRDWDMWKFYKKNKEKFDTFHSTSNQYPLCVQNGIATIHDITFKFYFDKPWWTFRLAQRYLNIVIKTSLNKAATVIAVSDATRNALIKCYNLDKEKSKKIKTIYEGWEHLIADKEEQTTVLTNEYGQYLFYVGTMRKHKNMNNLLTAFSIAILSLPKEINLVLTGSKAYLTNEDQKLVNLINENKKRVIFTGYVSKQNLNNLFQKSDAFIFPSLSEGFGIPILESFYFEKPVLCSQTTSLGEIAGDAALLFNPEDVNDIAEKICFFYANPEIKAVLMEKGTKRLAEFSWQKAAKETIEIYKAHFNLF